MSSATQVEPYAARKLAGTAGQQIMDGIARLGLSPRQQALNDLWAWYRCQHYDARATDWDGSRRSEGLDREVIATAGYIPPGFYDAANASLPLKYRRPSAPYALVKVIVDRFTGLLFSERHHPEVRVEGDPKTEDYMRALAEEGRLWPMMIQARNYGGAMGSVALGFQFVNGKPRFEMHDARWCVPDFADRSSLRLRSIEKRYQYPVERRDPDTGRWEEVPHWYRRIIDEESDVLFEPVEVPEDGSEPEWEVQERVDHRLGFCPVVWVQNLPVDDSVDGDPDCHGVYDLVESIDTLVAQANTGVVSNCDPTVVVRTDAALPDIQKGSRHALKLPKDGDAKYLELTGSGPESAFAASDKLRAYALEVAQCVLDSPSDTVQKTATEIERVYSSMLAKADVLREQYGQKGVLPLLDMAVRAVRRLSEPRPVPVDAGGGLVRGKVALPARLVPRPDGTVDKVERELGPGGNPQLQWGPYFAPSLADVQSAVTAAGRAKESGLIDREHASGFVASMFHVEDVPQMLAKIEREKEEEARRVMEEMMPPGYDDGRDEGGPPPDGGGEGAGE